MSAENPPSTLPVSLNEASASELQRVRGLGEVLARRIVAYRDEHGPFTALDDLGSVSGIGLNTLRRLAPQLTVAPRPAREGTDAGAPPGLEPAPVTTPTEVAPALEKRKGSEAMGIERPGEHQDEGLEPAAGIPPAKGPEPKEQAPAPEAGEEPPPPERPRVTRERREGDKPFWQWPLAALLGGLVGVLLTLLILLLLTGTLRFASSREVAALSRNLDTLARNQQHIADRVGDLAQRTEELEQRTEELATAIGRIDDLEAQLERAADDLEALQGNVSDLREQVTVSLRSMDRRINALDQSLSSLEETVEALQETVDDVQDRVQAFDAFFAALRDLLIDLQGPPEDTQGAATPSRLQVAGSALGTTRLRTAVMSTRASPGGL